MKIGIIGTGWLGLPLKNKLESLTTECFGTRSSQKDFENSIFQFSIGDTFPKFINTVDFLIITVPPRLRRKTDKEQLEILKKYKEFFNQIDTNIHLIYTSSTSVYSGLGNVDENSKCSGTLFEIEQLIRQRFDKHLILRLGGLAGPNRFIVDILSRKEILNGYNLPTNLLHLNDAIKAIETALTNKGTGTYNLCSPEHPDKWNVYSNWIKNLNLKQITKGETSEKLKTVDSKLFIKTFDFSYEYQSPLNFQLK